MGSSVKKEELFLQSITFQYEFSEKLTSLYEPQNDGSSIRKIRFVRMPQPKSGFIIGTLTKMDGTYHNGKFTSSKAVKLFKVVTAMNEISLVPVIAPSLDRIILEKNYEDFYHAYLLRNNEQ